MAVSFVNSTALRIASPASTWSMPVPAVTAGGAMVVCVGMPGSTAAASTVTDNAGNTYLKIATQNLAGAAPTAEMWYATNVASCTRVSLTMSASSSGRIASAHFTGISTGNPLGPSGSSATAASSIVSGVTLNPTGANVIVIFTAAAVDLGAVTPAAGYNVFASTTADVNFRAAGLYSIQAAANSTDGRFTTGSARDHATVIAAFYDTNGAAAPVVILPWLMSLMGTQ